MRYRVEALAGALLDAAVAKANGDTALPNFVMYQPHPKAQAEPCLRMQFDPEGPAHYYNHTTDFAMWVALRYSTEWDRGGPIIERERIDLSYSEGEYKGVIGCMAWKQYGRLTESHQFGTTGLQAAMRAYVASKFGEEVELP